MYKTTDKTKLFVRFLREMGIKYTYVEETLQFAYIKKYERKEFSRFISDEVDGNLLKYFDKCFPRGLYNVISYSFIWDSTKNGYKFWHTVYDMWVAYNSKNLYGAENFIH